MESLKLRLLHNSDQKDISTAFSISPWSLSPHFKPNIRQIY